MTKTKGRPKLPDDEKLVHVSLRLPKWLIEAYDAKGTRSAHMRHALEHYLKDDT